MRSLALKRLLRRAGQALLLALTLVVGTLSCQFIRASGENPDRARRRQFAGLPNYREGQFQNQRPTPGFSFGDGHLGEMLADNFRKPATVTPAHPVPAVRTDLRALAADTPTVVWFGHSTVLVKYRGFAALFDPSFSGYAAPFSWAVRAFPGANTYSVDDLPPLDVLVVSHDHYDHLDYETIQKLRRKVRRVVVPLGIGSHLRYWGYDSAQVTELNWHQSTMLPGGARLTLTPDQHMSGRGLAWRRTLWASYVLELPGRAPGAPGYRLFFSGDTGYGPHFAEIGARYGPFDLALIENGQFNKNWHDVHLFPRETVRAAQELRARTLLPIHWARFALAYHPWNGPIQELLPLADSAGLPVTVPRPGEPFVVGAPVKRAVWWLD